VRRPHTSPTPTPGAPPLAITSTPGTGPKTLWQSDMVTAGGGAWRRACGAGKYHPEEPRFYPLPPSPPPHGWWHELPPACRLVAPQLPPTEPIRANGNPTPPALQVRNHTRRHTARSYSITISVVQRKGGSGSGNGGAGRTQQ
jgi:hypothetical protein